MGSAKSSVNVKIDTEIKEQAAGLLSRMGIDQTTAIEMFYRQIIAERRLPFQPVVKPTVDEMIVSSVMRLNIPTVSLETDGDGNVLVDRDQQPALYDWAMNG
jgi:DNA-damage-inducible protein J